jgi:hypothetical protein
MARRTSHVAHRTSHVARRTSNARRYSALSAAIGSTHPEPGVLCERFDPAERPHLARLLTNGGDIAEQTARLESSVPRVHAAFDEALGAQFDMCIDLRAELIIVLRSPERGRDPSNPRPCGHRQRLRKVVAGSILVAR